MKILESYKKKNNDYEIVVEFKLLCGLLTTIRKFTFFMTGDIVDDIIEVEGLTGLPVSGVLYAKLLKLFCNEILLKND